MPDFVKLTKIAIISDIFVFLSAERVLLRETGAVSVKLFVMDIILGIESSCDDTSAAVIRDGYLLSNVLASQDVHKAYGGVIPELASRAHQLNIVPVVSQAIDRAGIKASDITAIAFTRGPGLLGSLLVGTSFAKGLSIALDRPLIEVNHLQGHVLANFIKQYDKETPVPEFPYLCLLVSGGNSQIVKVNSPLDFEILGQTIDDAVGEAFDKCSKMMGLGYPGGPVVDRLAKLGDPRKFHFAKPHVPGLDYSFSGVKTSLLYFVRDQLATDPDFMENHRSGFHGEEQGGYMCIVPEDTYRDTDGQADKGCEADRDKADYDRWGSVGEQRIAYSCDGGGKETWMDYVSS